MAAAPPADGTRESTLTVAVACVGFFVITLDTTVVNVALPTVGTQLHAQQYGGIAALQWVVDSYTLVFAACMLSAGAVSDRIGASRAFSVGLGVFAAASAVCGLAPNLPLLVAVRVVQGVAGAAMLPASLALVRQTLTDPVARAKGVALWTAGGGAAVSAGPVIGGLLTSTLGWRAVFFVNVPIGILGVLALVRRPRSAPRPARLDLPGQALAVLALAGLTFGVIEGAHRGFGDPVVLGALMAAVLGVAGFVTVQRRSPHPSVPLDQFRGPTVVACTVTGFALNFAFYGAVFVLTVFFQTRHGASPLVTGLLFAPMTVLIMVTNLLAGRLINRFGPRLPLAAGQIVQALGFLAFLAVGPGAPLWAQLLALVPVGIGMGTASPPMMTALLDAVPPDRAGLASGVLNAARQIGSALGVALFGALIADPARFDTGLAASLALAAGALLATVAAVGRRVRPGRDAPAARPAATG